jgi:hypothetical protein
MREGRYYSTASVVAREIIEETWSMKKVNKAAKFFRLHLMSLHNSRET